MKKVLVVGSGSIAQKHIKILNSLKYEVYVYSENNSLFFKKNLKLFKLTKLTKLNDFNFAIIANKTLNHLKILKLLVKEKLHIYCEKPIYYKKFNFQKLRNQIKKNKIIFHSGYQLRCDTKIKYLINKLKKNKQIKIKSFLFSVGHDFKKWRKNGIRDDSYFSNTKKGGGVIFELVHEINLIHLFFGKVAKIATFKSNYDEFNCEDTAVSIIKMENNIIGSLHQDMFSKVLFRRIKIITNKITFDVDMVKNILLENNKVLKFKNINNQKDLLKRNLLLFIRRIDKQDYSLSDYETAIQDLKTCLKMHNVK